MTTNKLLAGVLTAFATITLLFVAASLSAQERVELLPFGDFESWNQKQITESKLIGGKTKTLYKIGGVWDCSNAHAKAFGVDKVSVSVRPEKRDNGTCCRMETTLEVVSAVGIDLKALATGSLYTGKMIDVVGMKQSSDPNSGIDMGVPFTGRPKALQLDYKAYIQSDGQIVHANAGAKVKNVNGRDKGQIVMALQYRWEENGHIYAYRVGTAHYFIENTEDWINNFRLPIEYGKIKQTNEYNELSSTRHKSHNSNGKMVPIEEKGWKGDMTPTPMTCRTKTTAYG